MNYSFPIYNEGDNNDPSASFHDYTTFLMETGRVEGINKVIFEKIQISGTAVLSDKQLEIVENLIQKFKEECEVCGERLTWNDLVLSDINGCLCAYHANQSDNE